MTTETPTQADCSKGHMHIHEGKCLACGEPIVQKPLWDCEHEAADAVVRFVNLDKGKNFMAEISLQCSQCGIHFAFMGLPTGVNMGGAAMSPDGLEARLAITPVLRSPSPKES